jgi:SAM-dependent methyltransferase
MCARIRSHLLVCSLLLASSAAGQLAKVKPDVGFVPTPQPVVEAMLQMAKVTANDIVYDLGCGDGRLVILAAKHYGARGVGIDIDPERIAEAKQKAAATKLDDRVQFREGDIFASDFADATVITLYLLNELNVRLRPQIFAQVKPGTRVVSHNFRMGEWEPDAQRAVKFHASSYDVFLWVVPANISGRWKLAGARRMKAFPETVLIEQSFQMITWRDAENGTVLGQGRVQGNAFNLVTSTSPDAKPVSFNGTVAGNTMRVSAGPAGATWTAERESGSEKRLDPAG